MRPGEFRRHLAEERDRAGLAGRQWHVQRWVDIGMSGADEVDATLTRMYVESQQTFPLSAHWWHG